MRRLLTAFFVGLLVLSVPAFAKQPLEYVAEGNYDGARAELLRVVGRGPNAAFHVAYLEGIIAQRKGDLPGAERIFREILAIKPDFAPARRSLSTLLARRGDTQAALFQAERFVATTSDNNERDRVQNSILKDGGKKSGFSPRFSFVPSSNANRGTSEKVVVIGGVPFVVNEASRSKSAVGISIGGTAWRNFRLSEQWSGTASIGADAKLYPSDDITNEISTFQRLDFGRRFEHGRISFGPMLEQLWQNGSVKRRRVGVNFSGSKEVGKRLIATLDIAYSRQTYPNRDFLNGTLLTVSPSLQGTTAGGSTYGFAIGMTQENTGREHLNHRDLGVSATLAHKWSNGLTLRGRVGYSLNRYEGNYPGSTFPRRDRVSTVGLTGSFDRFQIKGFMPSVGVVFTDNQSNIGLQDYKSQDFSFNFSKNF